MLLNFGTSVSRETMVGNWKKNSHGPQKNGQKKTMSWRFRVHFFWSWRFRVQMYVFFLSKNGDFQVPWFVFGGGVVEMMSKFLPRIMEVEKHLMFKG